MKFQHFYLFFNLFFIKDVQKVNIYVTDANNVCKNNVELISGGKTEVDCSSSIAVGYRLVIKPLVSNLYICEIEAFQGRL